MAQLFFVRRRDTPSIATPLPPVTVPDAEMDPCASMMLERKSYLSGDVEGDLG
jgi:hypothetical protein